MSYPSADSLVENLFLKGNLPGSYSRACIRNRLTDNHILTGKESAPEGNSRVIKDVPNYLEIVSDAGYERRIKSIRQYPGFMAFMGAYQDASSYLESILSKRNLKNLRSKRRKLEIEHNISFHFYSEDIVREEYDRLFDLFYVLLQKRFVEKKMHNRYLKDWEILRHKVYPLMQSGDALLFVIQKDDLPITLTLNFRVSDILFSYIQVYDTDFSRFNLGDIAFEEHLGWCYENGISVFDLMMGETPYKIKWCNHRYDYEYHIFFALNPVDRLLGGLKLTQLRLKQWLRDKGIAGKLIQIDKIKYQMKSFRRANG